MSDIGYTTDTPQSTPQDQSGRVGAVRYDQAQSLSEAQKSRAVTNIGAVSVANPAEGDMIQRVGTSWVTRTLNQIKTALGLGSAAYTASTDYATAAQGTDSREWTAATIEQVEAEAGTATTRRAWTAQRVRQAIAAWWATHTVTWESISGKPSTFAPSAHKSSHATGGSDALTPADIGAVATSNTSTGGNGAADSGKVAIFETDGSIWCKYLGAIDKTLAPYVYAALEVHQLMFADETGDYIIKPPSAITEQITVYFPLTNGTVAITANASGVPDNLVTSSTKTTPIDADSVLITDSAAAGTPAKRVTFANLWTWIKGKIEAVALTLTGVTITNYTEATVAIGNSGASQTINLTNGTKQSMTLTANCTVTLPTATNGKSFVLRVNTGAGSYVPLFEVSVGVVKWPDNTAPTFNSTANRYYNVVFEADGTNWTGAVGPTYHS
jgi:hypothetical protein